MDTIQDYSSSEEEIEPVAIDLIQTINPYLQNFSHQKNMSNFFVSIPWKPNMASLRRLQAAVNPVLRHLELHHNDFYSRYEWHIVGSTAKKSNYSVSAAENMGHHISILMNCQIKSQFSNKFISNFTNAIQTLQIPQKLISIPPQLPMHKVLPQLATKSIQLQFEPMIQLLPSATTPSIFITGKLRMNSETQEFIDNIRNVLRDVGVLVDIPLETIEKEFVKTHHISLVKTSDQILSPELDKVQVSDKIELINKELLLIEHTELSCIPININSIELKEFTTKTTNHEIPFVI